MSDRRTEDILPLTLIDEDDGRADLQRMGRVERQPSAGLGRSLFGTLREVAETIILTLVIFFLLQLVVRNFKVDGSSMEPNLHDGQFLIVDKVSYRLGEPWRGDVIVFVPPLNPYQDYIKRVIALPGETIEIHEGRVLINGEPLEEPYQPLLGSYSMPPRVLGSGEYFVMGDNRNNSNDSRNWGPLPRENIVGRAWFCYWPPWLWGVIPRDRPVESFSLRSLLEQPGLGGYQG